VIGLTQIAHPLALLEGFGMTIYRVLASVARSE
jgi:hypothetical protein